MRRASLTTASIVSVSAVVSALQLLPMSSKKKNGQVNLTRETVATDPCTLEGPSPGGDGGDTVGTKALLVTQKLKNWLYTPASRTAVTPLSLSLIHI